MKTLTIDADVLYYTRTCTKFETLTSKFLILTYLRTIDMLQPVHLELQINTPTDILSNDEYTSSKFD